MTAKDEDQYILPGWSPLEVDGKLSDMRHVEFGAMHSLLVLALGKQEGRTITLPPALDRLPAFYDGVLAMTEGHPFESRIALRAEHLVHVQQVFGSATGDRRAIT